MKCNYFPPVVAALVFTVAACTSDLATNADSEQTTTGPVAADEGNTKTAIDSVELALAENECPATEVGLGAADTFDEAGLRVRNSQFVPLNDPEMVAASDVTWLRPDDVVMGVAHESGEVHAYPVSQMIYHHVVNTTINGEPYLVTY